MAADRGSCAHEPRDRQTWSGRFADAERHLSEGAALARTIDRPYLEIACRAYLCFSSQRVSFAVAPAGEDRCPRASLTSGRAPHAEGGGAGTQTCDGVPGPGARLPVPAAPGSEIQR
jgi:hypothetical protein